MPRLNLTVRGRSHELRTILRWHAVTCLNSQWRATQNAVALFNSVADKLAVLISGLSGVQQHSHISVLGVPKLRFY